MLLVLLLATAAATPIARTGTQPLIHRPSNQSFEAHAWEYPKVPPVGREVVLEGQGWDGDYFWPPRSWDLWDGMAGVIKMTGLDRCLEAGSGELYCPSLTLAPAVGSELKVWTCHAQNWQQWSYADGWLKLVHYGELGAGGLTADLCVGRKGRWELELQVCDYTQAVNGDQRFFATRPA